MRFLQVTPYLYPALAYGGPGVMVYQLAKKISKKHQVTIYTSNVWNQSRTIKPSEKLSSSKNLSVHYFNNLSNTLAYNQKIFTHFSMLAHFIKHRSSYDLIHIHDVFILPQLLLVACALLFKIPIVFSTHGILQTDRLARKSLVKSLMLIPINYLLKRVQRIVCTSEIEAQELKPRFANVHTIRNGVIQITKANKIKYFKNLANLKNQKLFVYIGRLHPQKGVIELVKAFSQTPQLKLVIAGPDDGALSTIQPIIKQSPNIHLVGLVDDDAKRELLSLADIFVYPSYKEGFSISIIEALSAGLPVLITKGCNFPEISTHHAGWVIDQTNLDTNITKWLQTTKLTNATIHKRAKNALSLYQKAYTISHMSTKFESLYESTLTF